MLVPDDLETPAMLVDADRLERSLSRMATNELLVGSAAR
jgi:D-serine deaminase-like pyridoxal phosphate-dependent protein